MDAHLLSQTPTHFLQQLVRSGRVSVVVGIATLQLRSGGRTELYAVGWLGLTLTRLRVILGWLWQDRTDIRMR
jgi:hypothetical protein